MELNHPFADRPIPILSDPPTTSQLGDVPVDVSDARYSEPLVDIRTFGLDGENYYARKDGANAPYCRKLKGSIGALLTRRQVAAMLANVDRDLSRHGLALWVYDAYRPVAAQKEIWLFFRDRIAAERPSLSDAELDAETRKYVSDPTRFDAADMRTWPLHSTGGAVDVILKRKGAADPLNFGTPFDDMTDASRTDHYESLLLDGALDANDERLVHRRVLYWVMRENGFTNYPFEYWHYDWGDQMHVLVLKALGTAAPEAAWYGYAPLPESLA